MTSYGSSLSQISENPSNTVLPKILHHGRLSRPVLAGAGARAPLWLLSWGRPEPGGRGPPQRLGSVRPQLRGPGALRPRRHPLGVAAGAASSPLHPRWEWAARETSVPGCSWSRSFVVTLASSSEPSPRCASQEQSCFQELVLVGRPEGSVGCCSQGTFRAAASLVRTPGQYCYKPPPKTHTHPILSAQGAQCPLPTSCPLSIIDLGPMNHMKFYMTSYFSTGRG